MGQASEEVPCGRRRRACMFTCETIEACCWQQQPRGSLQQRTAAATEQQGLMDNNSLMWLSELKLLTVDRDGQQALANTLKQADEVLDEFLLRTSPSKLAFLKATSLLTQQQQLQQQQLQQEGGEEAPVALNVCKNSTRLALLCTMHYSSRDEEDVANAVSRFLKQRATAEDVGGEAETAASISFPFASTSRATIATSSAATADDDVEVHQLQAINSFAHFRKSLMQQVIVDDDDDDDEEDEEEEEEGKRGAFCSRLRIGDEKIL